VDQKRRGARVIGIDAQYGVGPLIVAVNGPEHFRGA